MSTLDLNSDTLPLLIRAFEDAKEKSKEIGGGASIKRIQDALFRLAQLSESKDVFLMFLEINQMSNIVTLYATDRIKEDLKRNIEKDETIPDNAKDAIKKLIDHVDLSKLRGEGDFYEVEKLYPELKRVINSLDSDLQKYILNKVFFDLQNGFVEEYFETLPDELTGFYDNVVSALEAEDVSKAREEIQTEIAILNNKLVGFPKI